MNEMHTEQQFIRNTSRIVSLKCINIMHYVTMVVGEKNHPLYRKHRCWILFKGHLCKTGDDVFKHDKTRGYWSLIMQNQRWIDKDRLLLNGSFQYLVYEHKQEPSITLKPQNLIEPSHKSKNKIGAWVPFCTGFKRRENLCRLPTK